MKPSALKRELTALQNMKFLYFFILCGNFGPPGTGSTLSKSMRFWIRNTDQELVGKTLSFTTGVARLVTILKKKAEEIKICTGT
jgi:hypothetical protein